MSKLYLLVVLLVSVILRTLSVNKLSDILLFFPQIILGLGSIMLLWLLVMEIDARKNFKLAEISSFFLAISPWHIYLTTQPIKYSLVFFSSLLIVLSFIKGVEKIFWFYFLFATYFVMFYLYLADTLILGLLIISLTFSFIRKILIINHKFVIFFAVSIVILLTVVQIFYLTSKGLSNTQTPVWLTDEQRREHGNFQNFFVILGHNKLINYSLSFVDHLSMHFSGDFLFISGDTNLSKRASDFGLLYFFDILFIALGLILIIKTPSYWKVILLWLLVAPIYSALSFQPPSALKSATMAIPLLIISALGLSRVFKFSFYSKNLFKYILLLSLALLIVWDISRFLHLYHLHAVG